MCRLIGRSLPWLLLAACAAPPPPAGSIARSDHFNGERFFNPDGEQGTGGHQTQSAMRLLEDLVRPPHHSWPSHVPVTRSRPPAKVEGAAMLVTWIGHSTVLIQTQGMNILTDPVWAERASPVSFLGVRRVREPGVRLRDLPRIDLILLSHDHYDHLDTGTLGALWRRDHPLIVTGLGNELLLRRYHIKAVARDWGQSVAVRPGIDVILDRAHHWSEHGIGDHDRTLWTGFTVTLPGGNLYFAGDTGPGDMRWAPEAARAGPVRFAILPIGAYHFEGRISGNHIGPDQAVTAFGQMHAAYALGVHWGTFELTAEAIDDPPRGLAAALVRAEIAPDRFRVLEAGQTWSIPPAEILAVRENLAPSRAAIARTWLCKPAPKEYGAPDSLSCEAPHDHPVRLGLVAEVEAGMPCFRRWRSSGLAFVYQDLIGWGSAGGVTSLRLGRWGTIWC